MKKKHNKSTKIAISNVVIIALVGISVFSLRSLADRKNDTELTAESANSNANTSTPKLLTRAEADDENNYVVAYAEVEEEPVYYEPVMEVAQAEIKDFVIVDNIIEDDTEIVEDAVVEELTASMAHAEPETEDYEEPSYDDYTDYDDSWYTDSVIDDWSSETEYDYSDYTWDYDDSSDYTWDYDDSSDDSWYTGSVIDDWTNGDDSSDSSWSDEEYSEPDTSWDDTDYEEADTSWDNTDYEEADTSWDDTDYEEPDTSWDDTDYDDTDYGYVSSNVSLGQSIVNYASQWVGVTPYIDASDRWTGEYYANSLTEGTDCSGFVSLIYGEFGIWLPTASDCYQYCVGTLISYDQLLPGDIVVYRYGGHVAIYAGNDMIIHCANPESGTVYGSMWYSDPTAYVRVVY